MHLKRLSNGKRNLFISLIVVVAIILFILIYWLTRSEAEKMVLSCRNIYKKSMKLEYVTVDDYKKKIVVDFEMKYVQCEVTKEEIPKIYKAITDKYFNSQNSKYEDYAVDIYFSDMSSGIGITFFNITKSLDSVEFHSSVNISIKDIAKLFPYISKLNLDPAYYDDISEIKGFTNLDYVFFSQGITYEEEKYILSLYPNCEVDAQGYDD